MDITKLQKKVDRYGKNLEIYKPGMHIKVNDKMQKNYSYTLQAPYGKDFDPDFNPALSPDEMLELGIFEGKYLNDCYKEFPKMWYIKALKKQKLSPLKPNASLNCFGIKSRLSLKEWVKRKWIPIDSDDKDVRGWFQWYCRYYIGRRITEIDKIQIKRWKSFVRHVGQIKANCLPKDKTCRPKQRQALLQWAYDPFI
jgi:hypothetical protein